MSAAWPTSRGRNPVEVVQGRAELTEDFAGQVDEVCVFVVDGNDLGGNGYVEAISQDPRSVLVVNGYRTSIIKHQTVAPEKVWRTARHQESVPYPFAMRLLHALVDPSWPTAWADESVASIKHPSDPLQETGQELSSASDSMPCIYGEVEGQVNVCLDGVHGPDYVYLSGRTTGYQFRLTNKKELIVGWDPDQERLRYAHGIAPWATTSRLPFRKLQFGWVSWRFVITSSPPLESGTTWSTCASRRLMGPPQMAHRWSWRASRSAFVRFGSRLRRACVGAGLTSRIVTIHVPSASRRSPRNSSMGAYPQSRPGTHPPATSMIVRQSVKRFST